MPARCSAEYAGYQRDATRAVWFAGVWIFAALACLTKGLTRHRLSRCGFCFALDFLSRSEDTVSRAFALGICVDFSFDRRALAHTGRNDISRIIFDYLVRSNRSGPAPRLTDKSHDFLGVPAYQFVILHVAWWFPSSIALLPGVIFAWRRVTDRRKSISAMHPYFAGWLWYSFRCSFKTATGLLFE